MAPTLDQIQDTKATDNSIATNPLINELNQTQSGGAGKDPTMVDLIKAGTAKVNEVFGNLVITGTEQAGPVLLSDNAAPDIVKIENSLKGKTPEQVKAIDDAFKKDHDGKGIEQVLAGHWNDRPADMLQIWQSLHPVEAQTPAARKDVTAPARPAESAEQAKAADSKALDILHKDPEVQAKHDALVKQAKDLMKEPALTKFISNLDKFEVRQASVQSQYEKEFEAKGMSSERAGREAEKKAHQQIKDTFDNVEKLLAHNPKAPVSDSDRAQLAQQVMHHAAEPGAISQGHYGTCTVAAAETRAYDKDPAQASRLVSEVATTGQYTRPGHAPIKLDGQSLQKQGEAATKTGDDKDGDRDYSSQLFEVTAVNVMLQHKNESTNPPGQLRYEQHKPVAGQTPDDNGERLIDYSQHPPKVLQNEIAMSAYDIAYVAKQISPQGSEGTVAITSINIAEINKQIVEAEFEVKALNNGKIGDTNDPQWAKKAHDMVGHSALSAKDKAEVNKSIDDYTTQKKLESDTNVAHVHSEQELKTLLAHLKHDGKLPVIIQVNTDNEPFWTESGGGNAGGAGGEHMVTITDYDEKTGKVNIRNQWDAAADHSVSTKQIYDATLQSKEEISELKNEVSAGRTSGHRDYVSEYELLRMEREFHQITDADFEKEITQVTIDKARDSHSGKISAQEFEAAGKEFLEMVRNIHGSTDSKDQALFTHLQKDVQNGLDNLGYSH